MAGHAACLSSETAGAARRCDSPGDCRPAADLRVPGAARNCGAAAPHEDGKLLHTHAARQRCARRLLWLRHWPALQQPFDLRVTAPAAVARSAPHQRNRCRAAAPPPARPARDPEHVVAQDAVATMRARQGVAEREARTTSSSFTAGGHVAEFCVVTHCLAVVKLVLVQPIDLLKRLSAVHAPVRSKTC